MTVSEVDADIGMLFERHADELHRYLARRVGAAADDLVGDTFVAALRGDFDARRGSARAWLYGIATNLANNHVRRSGREDGSPRRWGCRPGRSGPGFIGYAAGYAPSPRP